MHTSLIVSITLLDYQCVRNTLGFCQSVWKQCAMETGKVLEVRDASNIHCLKFDCLININCP